MSITEVDIMTALHHAQSSLQKTKKEIRTVMAGGSKKHIRECIEQAMQANTHAIELLSAVGKNDLPANLKQLNKELRELFSVWAV